MLALLVGMAIGFTPHGMYFDPNASLDMTHITYRAPHSAPVFESAMRGAWY